MTINEIVTYLWANHAKICSEIAQLFLITYTLILPKIYAVGIPDPWNNILMVVATLLTAYGFQNSTVVQGTKAMIRGTKAIARKCFVKI